MNRPLLLLGAAASILAGCGSTSSSSGGGNQGGSPFCSGNCECLRSTPLDTGFTTPTGCSPGAPVVSVFPALVAGGGVTSAQSLGRVQVGQSVTFTVPPGTASVTVVEQASGSVPISITVRPSCQQPFVLDNVAVPVRIRDPGGTVVFDDLASTSADPEALAAFFDSDAPFTGTVTFPNTARGLSDLAASRQLTPGTWTLTVGDYAFECTLPQADGTCEGGSQGSAYDVTVITKPATAGGGIPASGQLDVSFYLATDQTSQTVRPLDLSSPAALAADPDLQRVRSALAAILGQAGISLRDVTFEALPADVRARYAGGLDVDQQGGCADVSQLLTNARPGARLNVFLVSSLHSGTTQGGNDVVGIDGTIPGPSSIGGTVASGMAVSTADLRSGTGCSSTPPNLACGDDVVAYIVAHEAGHFLGLYHTTEAEGTAFDPLSDTDRCTCSSCAPAAQRGQCSSASSSATPYQVTLSDCSSASRGCGGADNLMFWVFSRGGLSTGRLTAQQGQVMRANALVQ